MEGRDILLSELRAHELHVEPDEPAEGDTGMIEPRNFAHAFMHQGALHVMGGGRHDFAFSRDEETWKEAFKTDGDVFRFETGSGSWRHIPTTGTLPVAHAYSGAGAIVEGYYVLYLGGYYKASYSSCWALSLSTWRWTEVSVKASEEIHPRFFPASCIVQQRIYAWGGRFSHGSSER